MPSSNPADPNPPKRRRPRSQPLEITYEIRYVDGEAGRFVAKRQAEVLRELLQQLPDPGRDADAGEPAAHPPPRDGQAANYSSADCPPRP
jgi:hypothetical protein